jgi:hypothetical protein
VADEFDRFLASSLVPAERLPDRRFVATVQARIVLDDQLARQRRAVVAGLIKQLIALLAVTAAVWVFGKASPVANFFAQTPGLGVTILLAGFTFVVLLFSSSSRWAARRFPVS